MKKTIIRNVHKGNSNVSLMLMRNISEKNYTIVFLTLDLLGNNIFFLVVGHRTPHRAFKSLLKHMYLRYEEIQYYFLLPIKKFQDAGQRIKRDMMAADLWFIITKLK